MLRDGLDFHSGHAATAQFHLKGVGKKSVLYFVPFCNPARKYLLNPPPPGACPRSVKKMEKQFPISDLQPFDAKQFAQQLFEE